MDRYATELQRHGVESVEREVRWLSELINAERTAAPAKGSRTGKSGTTRDVQGSPAPLDPR